MERQPATTEGARLESAGFVVSGKAWVVRSWDPVLERLAGVAAHQVVGKPLLAALPHTPASWQADLRATADQRTPRLLRGGGPFAAGAERAIAHVFPVDFAGEEALCIFVVDAGPLAPRAGDDVSDVRRRLEELGMIDDSDFLAESLDEFLRGGRALARDISAAVREARPEDAVTAAHRLAGSALTLGAAALGEKARDLERAAGRGELPLPLVEAVLDEADRVFRYCERLIDRCREDSPA